LKCEPYGKLNLNEAMLDALGLGNFSPAQKRLASSMFMTKPVVPSSAAMTMLGISIVTQKTPVETISTVPPLLRTRQVNRRNGVSMKPVDHYMNRPNTEELEIMPCKEYLRDYLVTKEKNDGKKFFYIGMDLNRRNHVFHKLKSVEGGPLEHTKITRFTDYNPRSQPEGFFYNLLLAAHRSGA
jgi:hypothetical protein